ncbi:uncharacterized protein H6S33_011379 [Morchella sextelata]|uniref:uncharacterized protein n=1 Tax=Morchella sextelata TaxID=1174677 RepID=UPI001D04C5A4|nr:uncharacterized protein H6S33_011379 [Morchella sextelata]KAH0610952.1 hypothetical protein H6S33_011379 [Morchella sextelata]
MSIRRRSRASSRPSPVELEVPADPNTFTWPERSRKKFVQLVALQCLVSPAPITNEHPIALELPEAAGRRKLPHKTEREIADHFAFLAAGDGSGAACCIEEGEGRLRFRLAMNEGVPEGVLEGLRNVLREVRRVANGEQAESEIKAAVWANVLDLEKAKVYADLVDRFTRGSRPLSEQFEDALGHSETSTDPVTDDDAHAGLQKIYDLCTRVTSTELARCTRELDRLLDTCYRFRGSRSFKSGLKAVPARRALVQMIEKLGRYKTASNALVLAARKFPNLFVLVDVESVPTLPALDERVAAGFKGVYIGAVAQDLTSSTEPLCMSRLRTITDLSNEKLASKYQDLCQSAPTAHAEMQLVKFYEENADIERPGFIGCSKKSCFLCGLFLQLQRRFAVSKAHQNIYHAWTVPTIRCASPENAVMLDFVVEKMSRIIEDSCKKMLWEKPDDSSSTNTSSPHKNLIASLPTAFSAPPPSSSGFVTPRSPLSPISPGFSRPSTAASNLHNIRASARQTPKPSPPAHAAHAAHAPHAPSKLTDSSGDSSSPEPGSPNLSSESSCTSVSEDSSKESSSSSKAPKRQTRTKHTEASAAAAAATVVAERMPAIMAADAPPAVPARSASRVRESPAARPGSSRSVRKRGSPVEAPKAEEKTQQQQKPVMATITRSQSVRVSRKAAAPPPPPAPPATPKAPTRSASVARRPVATPEIPARGGRVRSASAMEVRKAPAVSDAESVSPGTASRPFGPLRRANTAPVESTATKSAIPVPRSVSRSTRKATTHTTPPPPPPRSPSQVRYTRVENPARNANRSREPSPGHITSSLLRHESPISIARFETAMAMAVTSVTGSPTMVELPPESSSARTTPRGSPNVAGRVSSRSRAQKRMSPLSVERTAECVVADAPAPAPAPAPAAGLGLKKSSGTSVRDSFASAATSQTATTASSSTAAVVEHAPAPAPALLHIDTEDDPALTPITVATPHGISIIDSSEESSLPTPRRSITERRGRALKRVEPTTAVERKRAAIDRATADAAAFVQENGFEAQRKRGMTIADVVQASGFQAQINRGMSGYYSDTETIRTRLRGGALSTISSEEAAAATAATSSGRSRLGMGGRRPQETEYTLYLAGPDHDDRTLGEKIFNGRLSDGNNGGGEMKQRAGCKLRTALRPAEKEISGMRVKEVSKSLEEMVLDIFFPDAVLRLEVVWDGQMA